MVVVRPMPCCGGDGAVGQIFTVSEIEGLAHHCKYCYATFPAELRAIDSRDGCGVALYRLKRIDPLQAPSQSEITTKEIA